jgi:5-methylcytosine-specific restriction endonuclease McrA
MNTSSIDSPTVLALNRLWQATGHRTVRDSLVALAGGSGQVPAALGMDIVYARTEDGWDFSKPVSVTPVAWADWLRLPIREYDQTLSTPRQRVRVPTVIITPHYSKMPLRRASVSREAIFQRDAGIDQYTGRYVPYEDGNLDHVIARHRGGLNTFENLVWTHRDTNSRKANKLPHEVGLTLLRIPKAPLPVPVVATLRPRHRDWTHFLFHAPP